MDLLLQALVLGIVQGLTEFLPISSSAHLIIVPSVLGWRDPFISSLAYAVMLHVGTLVALLIYFRADWIRLAGAGLRLVRERSVAGDPDRRLALLLLVTVVPAALVGVLLNDVIEREVRSVGLVTVMLLVGAAILWLADRWGSRDRGIGDLSPRGALGIGVAQAAALIPGISRSGISISAGLFLGLDRASAARFSFLMAMPITAGAALFEARQLVSGDIEGARPDAAVLAVGVLASFIAGIAAIHFLLRYVRTNTMLLFVIYRVVLAVLLTLWLLG